MDQAACRFWWGCKKEEGSYYTPKSWESLCQPKASSGLGFRRAEDSNRAMLSKMAWALTSHFNSLATRAMKANYGNFLQPYQR
ncbi:hypothetical protein CDL15_Pgr003117 [Punica granatum]|uniref:Uncharacterized protein n=1 Tax=Punica granatum TaxID=22663 RepID=A0A218X2L6_PUNGR|nr:hypothetical protein CDL15_Pgr003117 [Punica granatum]